MEPMEGNTMDASKSKAVSTKQQRIAKLAKQSPEMSITSLNHYLDLAWMKEAYSEVRKDSAPGVDRQTVVQYGERLEENLRSLISRAKSGDYFAPPVRRVYLPKGKGKEPRAIGVPTTEDKVLQRAVTMVLEPIYEQDFLDCSYGFRPGRSTHQALAALWKQVMGMGIQWILDVDIQKFFDTLNRAQLRELLKRRVCDGVITKTIGKWLNAGVLEQGTLHYPKGGTPQGGVISPMLSNVYLHYVLDEWFANEVKPRLKGKAFMTRFCDDFVIGFEKREDAERVQRVLPKRFGRYGLTIHPEKTCLLPFGRPNGKGRKQSGTFDFLGFTHYWGKSRKGQWVVKRKTASKRFGRGLKRIAEWCRKNRHRAIKEQHSALSRKLKGHYTYYGITGNGLSLQKFKDEVGKVWRKWLARRSRERESMPWERFNRLIRHRPLPPVRIVQPICAAKP